MAEKYSFFDSTVDDERQYPADDFAQYFRTLFKNGVFLDKDTNALKVTAAGSTMETVLSIGTAYLEGYRYETDASITFTHAQADQALTRYDRIVIRLDKDLRTIKAQVKQGVAGGTAPELERTAKVFELCVATVTITAGKSYIDSTQVADERLNEELCGLASPTHMKIHGADHGKGGTDPITPEMIGAMPTTGGDFSGPITVNGKSVGAEDIDTRTQAVTFYVDPLNGDNNNDGLTTGTPLKDGYGLANKLKTINLGPRRIEVIGGSSQDASLYYALEGKPFMGGEIRVYGTGQEIWSLDFEDVSAQIYIEGITFKSIVKIRNCSSITYYNCTFDFGGTTYGQGIFRSDEGSNVWVWSCRFLGFGSDLFWCNNGSKIITQYCTFNTSLNAKVYNAFSGLIFIDNNQYTGGPSPMKTEFGGGKVFETL